MKGILFIFSLIAFAFNILAFINGGGVYRLKMVHSPPLVFVQL